jgi:hypothetical protein
VQIGYASLYTTLRTDKDCRAGKTVTHQAEVVRREDGPDRSLGIVNSERQLSYYWLHSGSQCSTYALVSCTLTTHNLPDQLERAL